MSFRVQWQDILGGYPIPVCPNNRTLLLDHFHHPGTTTLNGIDTLVCLVFCIVILTSWNSVKVFNRRIHSNSVTNTWWIIFFGLTSLRSLLDTFRYGLGFTVSHASNSTDTGRPDRVGEQRRSDPDAWFVGCNSLLQGLIAVSLALALNHQRLYRSSRSSSGAAGAAGASLKKSVLSAGAASEFGGQSIESSRLSSRNSSSEHLHQPLLAYPDGFPQGISGADAMTEPSGFSGWVKKILTTWTSVFVGTFFFHLIVIYLDVAFGAESDAFFYLYIASYALLRLPIVVLNFIISFSRTGDDGPTSTAKAILAIAGIGNISQMLPLNAWSRLLEGKGLPRCIVLWASFPDVLGLIELVTLILEFVFVKMEFKRNMEECIWSTVSAIQDTFDFRKF